MDLSVLIPARHEEFLNRTIQDVLENSTAETDILVGFDGEWPIIPLEVNPRVRIIYHNQSIGQRAMTNELAKISTAKYLMKLDAHCAVSKGFDTQLLNDIREDWVIVPTMRNLHAFDWVCKSCGWRKYQGPTPEKCESCGGTELYKDVVWIAKNNPQSNSYCFDSEPHFQYFNEYTKRPESKAQGKLTETMSLQGSCFMLSRENYFKWNVCDESFGSWGSQGIEVACKTWLMGGRVIVDHFVWYAHLFRTQGGDFGFPYPINGNQVDKAKKYAREIFFENKLSGQIKPLSWLIEKFWPMPGWQEEDLSKLKSEEMKVERSGIYSIKNKESGKTYVGSSVNIARRFEEHLRMLHRGNHENEDLQNSWNKDEKKNLSFNIEYFCKIEDLDIFEQKYIDIYKEKIGWDNIYNINPEASSCRGHKYTQESLDKTSEQQSDEDTGFYEKTHAEESKEKIGLGVGESNENKGRNEKGHFIKTEPTKGIIYYTDNLLDKQIMLACQNQLLKANLPITSCSLKPINFGKNVTLPLERGVLTMFRQILAALENIDTTIVFFGEHDLLYHVSHFDFIPPDKETFYYNMNSWLVRIPNYRAVYYDHRSLNGLCVYRETAITHYKERIAMVEKDGFHMNMGYEPFTHHRIPWINQFQKGDWKSEYPNLDIKHSSNLTPARWSPTQFRDQRNCRNWHEFDLTDEIPGWDVKLRDFNELIK
jgi:group I intron endonuclease